MRSRLSLVALFTVAWALALCPAALAEDIPDNGEGFLGELDDKIVTFFSLGVLIFFALLVTLATIVQSRLERRKEEKKAARVRQRIGW